MTQASQISPAADAKEVTARVHAQLDLVDLVARQVARSLKGAVEFDDLVGFGRVGLLDAARRFDPNRGMVFRSYASLRIRGAMLDGVRHTAALPRRAFERLRALEAANQAAEGSLDLRFDKRGTPAEAEAALGERLALTAAACASAMAALSPKNVEVEAELRAAGMETPEEQFSREERALLLRKALDGLDVPREAEILRLYYFEDLTFDAISQKLGLERTWVGRLHARALHTLSRTLRSSHEQR